MSVDPCDVAIKRLNKGTVLQHCSRSKYRGTDLHFGHDPRNRYDDPRGRFGCLYLGKNLDTCLLETAFHDHSWDSEPTRIISSSEVASRIVRVVRVVRTLRLANLATEGVARTFGLTLANLIQRPPDTTQKVSAELHDDPKLNLDGIFYEPRQNPGAWCVALYSSASAKVELVGDIDLIAHTDWPTFVRNFCILVA